MSETSRLSRIVAALALMVAEPTPTLAAPAPAPAPTSAPASAEAPQPGAEAPRVWAAVVPRGGDDGLPGKTDASLRDGIADGLRRAGVDLVDAGVGSGDVACASAACLGALAERLGVAYLVQPTLAVVDREYRLHLALFDARSGAVIREHDDRCRLCSLAEARARIEGGAAELIAPVLVPPTPAPRLTLTTTPARARVTVDGVDLGLAPLEHTLPAGRHRVRAREHGHRDVVHEVELVEGERVDLHLVLTPIVRPPPPPPPPRWGWIPLTIGVPITAAGITLAAIDGSTSLGCGTARDGCSTRLETTWPAAAALVTGAALTTLGAVLIHQARRVRRARADGAGPGVRTR